MAVATLEIVLLMMTMLVIMIIWCVACWVSIFCGACWVSIFTTQKEPKMEPKPLKNRSRKQLNNHTTQTWKNNKNQHISEWGAKLRPCWRHFWTNAAPSHWPRQFSCSNMPPRPSQNPPKAPSRPNCDQKSIKINQKSTKSARIPGPAECAKRLN